jgi:hypothetical protein
MHHLKEACIMAKIDFKENGSKGVESSKNGAQRPKGRGQGLHYLVDHAGEVDLQLGDGPADSVDIFQSLYQAVCYKLSNKDLERVAGLESEASVLTNQYTKVLNDLACHAAEDDDKETISGYEYAQDLWLACHAIQKIDAIYSMAADAQFILSVRGVK